MVSTTAITVVEAVAIKAVASPARSAAIVLHLATAHHLVIAPLHAAVSASVQAAVIVQALANAQVAVLQIAVRRRVADLSVIAMTARRATTALPTAKRSKMHVMIRVA